MAVNRREFILSIAAAAGLIAINPTRARAMEFESDTSNLEDALIAFCETVIPGQMTDEDESPGALSAGAHLMLANENLEICSLARSEIHCLNTAAFFRYGRKMEALNQEKREMLLERQLKTRPDLYRMVLAVKDAYYSAAMSPIGQSTIGFPFKNDRTANPVIPPTWRETIKDGNP